MSHIKITKTEWEIMRILWTQGECYSSDVIALLSEKFDWKPSTVKTLISRLVKRVISGNIQKAIVIAISLPFQKRITPTKSCRIGSSYLLH